MNRSMTMTMAAALTGLTLFVTACTGGGSSDGKKDGKDDGKTSNASSGTGKGSGTSGADADKALKTRKCLREHGIDAPDPEPGQDPRGMTLGSGSEDPEALKKAFEACGMQAPGSGEMSQADKDKALKWAKCMRDNGVNIPDPTFNGSAMSATQIPEGQEKAFEEAQKKCEAA
ncbi:MULTISPECIES: hypothetical protein [unclassified Streptomyces]|uniref:hypothetical protein n=1 Tax=unclassified Streptomyces TaxID=2593676 RepID=UPI0022513506|nr:MULTISPECIES: hypothetical protein [unclassified Streptomyces]MCX4526404.1 hypothetical protein [Streptomyces sp. NBC_01551]MCX4543033.1 hypothetical protein [Streptomyces sp. NBC_01565]